MTVPAQATTVPARPFPFLNAWRFALLAPTHAVDQGRGKEESV
jgi:hypothetical protein